MSLPNLKREYEARRAALVQQLQSNQKLDPATQHQIYGAIKEIENFLRTIDYQLGLDQEKNLQVELERQKPSPFVEKTKGAVSGVAKGTKKVFVEHIPNAAKAVYNKPKQAVTNYFDKRREEARLRDEIETELRRRMNTPVPHNGHIVMEHPHQELEVKPSLPNEPAHVDVSTHDKREEPMAPLPPKPPRPSLKAKKGHQHKPHVKKGKAPRFRGRR